MYSLYYKRYLGHSPWYVSWMSSFLAKMNCKMAWFLNWPEVYLTLDSPQIVLCGKDHDERSQKELPNQVVISSCAWAPFNEFSINGNPLGHSWFCIPESKPSSMELAALRNAKIHWLEKSVFFCPLGRSLHQ